MLEVHPSLSSHLPLANITNYFPSLPDRSFDFSYNGRTHEMLTAFISTARISDHFLCALGAKNEFAEESLESKLILGCADTHGNLVNLVHRSIRSQENMLQQDDIPGLCLQPLESFIILHHSNKDYFDYFVGRLGCRISDSWRVYNCISSNFSYQLHENRIYDFESLISKKLNLAIRYSKFLSEQFGKTEMSDEVLTTLSRLSVLGDFGQNSALSKLAYAHISQTQELLCSIFSRQLELLSPAKDRHANFHDSTPKSLETVYLKPEVFINKKAAAEKTLNFRREADYIRLLDAMRCLLSGQIEKNLPLVSPHIAIYCIQNAAYKAHLMAGAKQFVGYSLRAASMMMSLGRFAATWIP